MTTNSKQTSGESEWIGIDEVLAAFQATMQSADERSSKAKGGFQFVVTEASINFPAEIRVKKGIAAVKLPSLIGKDKPSIPESHLSRLTFSLKPIPSIVQEPVKSETLEKVTIVQPNKVKKKL